MEVDLGLVEEDGGVREERISFPRPRRGHALMRALFTPYDRSAGMLLYGALGLVLVWAVIAWRSLGSLSADIDEIVEPLVYAEATELIAEACVALELEATAESIMKTIHAHPTLSEALMEAAEDVHGHAIHY